MLLPGWKTHTVRLSREASGVQLPCPIPIRLPSNLCIYDQDCPDPGFPNPLSLLTMPLSLFFVASAAVASFTNIFPFLLQDLSVRHHTSVRSSQDARELQHHSQHLLMELRHQLLESDTSVLRAQMAGIMITNQQSHLKEGVVTTRLWISSIRNVGG